MQDLPIIQKMYDFILWYVPIINRLPRSHKFTLGDRMILGLYEFLDELILVRYLQDKLPRLEALNNRLDILRYQTRLLHDFGLIKFERYEHAGRLISEIGTDLGGWMKQQRKRKVLI
jgi:hypothetical protein